MREVPDYVNAFLKSPKMVNEGQRQTAATMWILNALRESVEELCATLAPQAEVSKPAKGKKP